MSAELAIPEAQSLSEWTDRRLDNAIRRGHNAAGRVMANYEHVATLTGVLLRERKARLGPRKFVPWIRENFDGSDETARRYMRLADEHVPIAHIGVGDGLPDEATDHGSEEIIEGEVIEENGNGPTAYIDEYPCPTCGGTGRVQREGTWNE